MNTQSPLTPLNVSQEFGYNFGLSDLFGIE